MIRWGLTSALVVATTCFAGAQEREPSDAAIDRAVERMLVRRALETEQGDFDELAELREDRIDLSTAAAAELARLPGISMQDAVNILDAVRRLRPRNFAELADSIGLSSEHLTLLRAFTVLGRHRNVAPTTVWARFRAASDLRRPRGAIDHLFRVRTRQDSANRGVIRDTIDLGPLFEGSGPGVLARVDLERSELRFGVRIEKDRWEPLVAHDTLDYSYRRFETVGSDTVPRRPGGVHLNAAAGGYLAFAAPAITIIAGDYTVSAGQGLVFGGVPSPAGSQPITEVPLAPSPGIKPFRSALEAGFLRGVAAELRLENLASFVPRLQILGSWRTLDGTLDSVAVGDAAYEARAASIRSDGMRRSRSEIRRSDNIEERIAGAAISVEGSGWRAGATWMRRSVAPADRGAEERQELGSAHLLFTHSSGTLLAEFGTDGRHVAGIGGGSLASGSAKFVASFRFLPPGFESPLGQPMPAGSANGNELGARAGIAWTHDPVSATISVDLAERPCPTTLLPFPSWKGEAVLLCRIAPSNGLGAELRGKLRRDVDGLRWRDSSGFDHRGLLDRTTAAVRLRLEAELLKPAVRLRWQAEIREVEYAAPPVPTAAGRPPEHGWATALDIRSELPGHLMLLGGIALFEITDYDATLSVVRNDLPGRVASVALNGRGRMVWLSLRWQPDVRVTVSGSYTELFRIVKASSADLDDVPGPLANGIELQIDVRIP